jgi:hypothetical protein
MAEKTILEILKENWNWYTEERKLSTIKKLFMLYYCFKDHLINGNLASLFTYVTTKSDEKKYAGKHIINFYLA